jgi:ABC-type phosphate transport system substrate-binding protein
MVECLAGGPAGKGAAMKNDQHKQTTTPRVRLMARTAGLGLLVVMLLAPGLHATDIVLTGAGATLPAPLYQRWIESYAATTGQRVMYYDVGSSQGITELMTTETRCASCRSLSRSISWSRSYRLRAGASGSIPK